VKKARMLLRVSSNQQLEADGDLSLQRNLVLEYIYKHEDWELDDKEYFEGSRSGYKTAVSERDTLQEALEDARNGEYDILVAYKDDRIGRRMYPLHAHRRTGLRYCAKRYPQIHTSPVQDSRLSLYSVTYLATAGKQIFCFVTSFFVPHILVRKNSDPSALRSRLRGRSAGERHPMYRKADLRATQEENAGNVNDQNTGTLQVSVISSVAYIPIPGATVTISYTGDPENPIATLTTDSSGETEVITLPTPPLSYSLDPESLQQPYSEYNILVTAEGYEPVYVTGSEMFEGELSLQPIRMNPIEMEPGREEKRVPIPVHTLFGEYPPKIPEDEIKPMAETGEIVLSRVVIPEYVIVHDGVPSDASAPNYWVRYKDYIKNVASCEIYSTWPEATLYANILVIMSFTLNRVYTEWYRNHHCFGVKSPSD